MKYYLVDYENVNSSGLDGVSELSEDGRIVLFYTKNSNKIDLGLFNQVRDMKAELSVIEVHHGKQALDIQLASYLGYLIGTEPEDTEYYIISKDKGYLNVQSFWPDRKITLCKNLYDDSVIVEEPKAKKKTSSSSSNGRRKTTTAKAPKAAKPAPAEEKPAAKEEEKPEAEAPATNAFAEAAAIAKAVVEASKARNAAKEQKDTADAPKKSAKKTASKKTSTKKTDAKKAESKKADAKKAESKKADAKKTDAKKAESKKSSPKQRISDTRAEVNNEIQKVLSKEGVDGDIVNSTASFVSKNIGKDGYKQTIYRGIIKAHGQKQGLAIYRLIKDIF